MIEDRYKYIAKIADDNYYKFCEYSFWNEIIDIKHDLDDKIVILCNYYRKVGNEEIDTISAILYYLTESEYWIDPKPKLIKAAFNLYYFVKNKNMDIYCKFSALCV